MGFSAGMRRGGRGDGELERIIRSLLRFDRLWWWLAVVAAVALLSQEIARSSAFVVGAHAEFEGFGDEADDDLDNEVDDVFVVPPPVVKKPVFQNDRGPPLSDELEEEVEVEVEEPLASNFKEKKASEQKIRQEQFWDEDEFEGLPSESAQDDVQKVETVAPAAVQASSVKKPAAPIGPQTFIIEFLTISFMIAFGIFYYFGRKENEKIALSWAAQYAGKESVFEKNFSLLGTGDGVDSPLLMKEGQNIFRFYASGRRYCEGLLATMDLQSRHDLIARLWYMIVPRKDEITIEVNMNEENMDPMVFALVRKKNAKSLHKDVKDLNQFATILAPPTQRKWVSDELVVISESRELASDLLTDALLDQVFGEKAFEKHASNFVSLQFSDQNPYGPHRKILQFKFTIPPSEQMSEISRLISVVTYFIDVVGRYKLSPQSRIKADNARAKIEKEVMKEKQATRQEALLKKKEEKRRALEDAEIKRLSPEGLRKREEKERARQMKKSMPKVKMTRAH